MGATPLAEALCDMGDYLTGSFAGAEMGIRSSTARAMAARTTVVGDAVVDIPCVSSLAQNYPNPFAPPTLISFSAARAGKVVPRIYDVNGQPVCTLVDRSMQPQRYEVGWDGRDDRGRAVAAGVYFYRLETPDFARTKKMVLMK